MQITTTIQYHGKGIHEVRVPWTPASFIASSEAQLVAIVTALAGGK